MELTFVFVVLAVVFVFYLAAYKQEVKEAYENNVDENDINLALNNGQQ